MVYMHFTIGFTTIEGIISTTCEELEFDQPQRRLLDPETAQKIDNFIARLRDLLGMKEPFQVVSCVCVLQV